MNTGIKKRYVLPYGLPPRGLSRVQAAEYVGVGATTFDSMVRDRVMPSPIRYAGRVIWDRLQLDAAMDALSDISAPQTAQNDRWSPVA